MAIQAQLLLREADGEFIEDTGLLTFACLPRTGEVIEYGRQYTVVRVIHKTDRDCTPWVCLLCNPAIKNEGGQHHGD